MIVRPETGVRVATTALERAGAPYEAATVQARFLVEGDLRGHPSHGIQRLPVIIERIRRGLIDPAATGRTEWQTASVLRVDGGRGFGPVVGTKAMTIVAERAHAAGVAVAGIANANHLGMLAPYVEEAVAHGVIAIALTTSEALVHPWGGTMAMLGTNPISVAVPAEPKPFVLDMATGAVSMGKILAYRNRNEPLPEGWARDENGRPTTDAAAAARGSIAPFGGGKGFALGLAVELLVAALTGAALGRDVHGTLDTTEVCNKGDVFICLDSAVFGVPELASAATDYLRKLRDSPREPGKPPVRIPGDRARETRERSLTHGVEVPDAVWRTVLDLAGSTEPTKANGSSETVERGARR